MQNNKDCNKDCTKEEWNDKECTICFEKDWLTTTKCGHLLCVQCLFKLPHDECPICRRSIQNTLPPFLRQFLTCKVVKKSRLDIESYHDFPSL